MQGQLQMDLSGGLAYGCAGDEFCLDLRADSTLFAKMREVGREAVAGVDHRRRQIPLAEDAAQLDSRLRQKVLGILARIQLSPRLPLHPPDSCRRATHLTAHIDEVAG